MKQAILSFLFLGAVIGTQGQTEGPHWNTPGAGNPFIPGYFADPTIRKFGDTYYLYATTDGNGNGYGPAQVWVSNDFRNWKNVLMSWPATEVVWAPDVMRGSDGQYHYFYCEPCVIHEGVGPTPLGPWKNVLGERDAVLVPDRFVHNAITLDGQTFVDDDGSTYLYFGTWGIYEGFGCGVAKMGSDLRSFNEKKLIPNTEIKDFFEAPYVLKKDGIYYFMYSSGSCHDHTYRVQYATSTVGPMGPYEYRGCILETNADGTVHGPGHHSVLRDGDDYYIVYHRHNLPRSTHGFHRQLCIDRLTFTSDGRIEPVVPTHQGVLPRSAESIPQPRNLAFGAKATASSYYDEWFRPDYATDDNNATLWKPATCTGTDWLQIDLGRPTTFREVWTQFEYATYYYQYLIETSNDAQQWTLYADRRTNVLPASPSIDKGEQTARYLRITVTGRQKNGHFGGIWNVKVFDKAPQLPVIGSETAGAATPSTMSLPSAANNSSALPWQSLLPDVTPEDRAAQRARGSLLVSVSANDYPLGSSLTTITNGPGGAFLSEKPVQVTLQQGRQAFRFTGSQLFKSNFPLPPTLCYSAPYTVAAWILNPEVARNECVALLMPEHHDLSTVELCNGSDPQNGLVMHNASFENSGSRHIVERQGQWQHWVVAYDGYMERHYLNGQLVGQKNMLLLLRPQDYLQMGASFDGKNPFDGYLHDLQVYDRALSSDEIAALYQRPTESSVLLHLQAADDGGVPCLGKLALTAPVVIDSLTSLARTASITVAFALSKGGKKGALLAMPGLQLSASRKGIVCNGQLTQMRLTPDTWHLLSLNSDGTGWLNGEPVRLSHPGDSLFLRDASQVSQRLTVGGKGVAVVSLVIDAKATGREQSMEAWRLLTVPPAHLSASLQLTPLTPWLVRATLVGPISHSWRIDETHPWTTEPSVLVTLPQSGSHRFQATLRDARGNVAQTAQVDVLLDEQGFRSFHDDFAQSALQSSWKVLSGSRSRQTRAVADSGRLLLQSAAGNFNAHADENAILVYQEVNGDFLVQGRVAGLMGSEQQQTPAYNEGGLMVLDDSSPHDQQIVQAGIFPNYNCGNMLTTVSRHGARPQFPVGNGWHYEPYLQIERQGHTFYVRTSSDGRQWHDAPGSPVVLNMPTDGPLKVGFFQVTYSEKLGSVTFDDFHLWQRSGR